MEYIVEIEESNSKSFQELLKNLKYIKSFKKNEQEHGNLSKKEILEDTKQAVKELNMVLSGQKEAQDARELLNEL